MLRTVFGLTTGTQLLAFAISSEIRRLPISGCVFDKLKSRQIKAKMTIEK
jgi:hypothetical protein